MTRDSAVAATLAATVIIGSALIANAWSHAGRPTLGCSAYTPAPGPLVAHAGGGLPSGTYANNLEALNLAVRHGFTVVELDFMERRGRLTLGHDGLPESSLTVAALIEWLRQNPSVYVITDIKTDNISGLKRLKAAAGPLQARFIPQIYAPGEFEPVRALGYVAPIMTVYRLQGDKWIDAANALPLRAVTMPASRRALAAKVRHPVFLHTLNEPVPGFGIYTDCLIPSRPTIAAHRTGSDGSAAAGLGGKQTLTRRT